jgi:hypothetical protein
VAGAELLREKSNIGLLPVADLFERKALLAGD